MIGPNGTTRLIIALFVVTAGAGIRQRSEEAKAAGEYLFLRTVCRRLRA